MGLVDDVLPWAQASEAAPLPARFRDGTTSIAAGAATLRASYWLQIGDMGQTRRIAFDAVKLERTTHWRAIATNCAGTASYWLGDAGEAQAQLEQTRRHSSQMPMLTIYALGILAAIHADRGEWDWAQEYADAALHLGEEANAAEYWMNAIAHVVQGKVLEHRGKLAEVEDAAARGVELARRGRYPMGVTYALITLAQVRDRLGNRDEARRLVCKAGTIVQKCPDPGFLADKVNTLDRNLSL